MDQAAVGFRIKSGWATAILIVGPSAGPRVIDRRIVQLADPEVPESTQPYHAAFEGPKPGGAKAVARLVKTVERYASRSVAQLIDSYREGGYGLRRAGIVVGSVIDPDSIRNEHIRAHAEEGRLFRRVIEEGMRGRGVKSSVIAEKEMYNKASEILGISEPQLKEKVTALGRQLGGPWRAEDKAAALAAWMVLA